MAAMIARPSASALTSSSTTSARTTRRGRGGGEASAGRPWWSGLRRMAVPALVLFVHHNSSLGSCFLVAPPVIMTGPAATSMTGPRTRSLVRMAASEGGDGGGPEPLGSEGDWSAYLDDQSTGLVYYFNARTGESRWVPPTASFPTVKLPRKMRQAAERKQAEYRKAVRQEQEMTKKKKGGLLAKLLLDDNDDDGEDRNEVFGATSTTTLTEEPPSNKQDEWFDFLSDRTATASASSPSASVAEAETRRKKKEADWFGWGKGKEKRDEPDWLSTLAKPAADTAPVSDFVQESVEAPEAIQADKKKKKDEPDWFSWLAPRGESGQATVAPLDSSTTEPPPPATEPAPTEPAIEPSEGEGAKKKSVLGKLFGAVPAVSVEVPKPVGVERIKPELVDKPKPVVIEKPKPKKVERVEVIEEVPTTIAPEMSTYVLPDPKKLFWGGEDATFVKGRTFGVFDGVSGADKLDGVPLYSLTLAREMKSRVGNDGLEMKDMIDVLSTCVEIANKRATGASTALVGSISEDGVLRVLNVGDCTAIVVRGDKVVARTKEINHFYECPYQFSEISPDRPRDGTRLNLALKKGDIIIAGSDGVFDNLEEDQIVKEVASSPKKASVIAKRVSDLSRRVSQNPKAVTPFSKMALKKKNPDYPDGIGGKVDDVCCVAVCYG